MDREELRVHAAGAIASVESILDVVKDGLQVVDVMGLLGSLMNLAPNVAFLQNASEDEKVVFGEEVFDLLTGTDSSALITDFIPGLDPVDEEQLLDLAKKAIGNAVRARLA